MSDVDGSLVDPRRVGESACARAYAKFHAERGRTAELAGRSRGLEAWRYVFGALAGAAIGWAMAGWDGTIHGAFIGCGVGNVTSVAH